MSKMKVFSRYVFVFIFGLAGYVSNANAVTVFSQDFESGLGANESSIGNFVLHGGMMGHAADYSNNEYSAYYLTVDLAGVSNAQLSFDYAGSIENNFDFFNVFANGTAITGGDLVPVISGITYTTHTSVSFSPPPELGTPHATGLTGDPVAGNAILDLSAYDGTLLDLIFQFGSDSSVVRSGINIDNVIVSGDDANLAVPLPASVALLGLGLVGISFARKKRQA